MVVEKYPKVIELFRAGHPDMPAPLEIVNADFFEYVEELAPDSVDGIFFDEAGNDFGVTPARRAAAVRAAHDCALSAFMNAFNPDDLFESSGLGANDVFVATRLERGAGANHSGQPG